MKKVDNYWVDENENRWDCDFCTEEKAEEYSRSLIDCYDCHDCYDCYDCYDCKNCYNCYNCYNCHTCINCNDCNDCKYCDDCNYCDNYILNPQIYTTKQIGSREDSTIFYYGNTEDGKSLQIVCECFKGNLEEFEKRVLEIHKDNEEYRNEYLREIEKVRVMFELDNNGDGNYVY